jgi:hypothetical protein
LVIVYARHVAPEDDPLRLKHVVPDITLKIAEAEEFPLLEAVTREQLVKTAN